MSKKDLFNMWVSAISDCLDEIPTTGITADTNPIDELGLDSLQGVEILMCLSLEDDFLSKVPDDFSPFVDHGSGQGPRSRTIGEIVDYMYELQASQEGENDEENTK